MPFTLGGNAEREYVFSQSIYPGQTYKAVIRDKYCEYRYESKLEVLPDGTIPDEIELKETRCINQINETKMSQAAQEYEAIITEKVHDWNNRSIKIKRSR